MHPSRTSQIVALVRARLDRPHTPLGDPDAQRQLCTGMMPIHASYAWSDIVARTRFFDEQVLKAISAGIKQIVICGAGYDDRALRFRTPGVKFFELDHPATQDDKARRLLEMGADTNGLALIPADFRHDDSAELLRQSGLDANQATLFACEGLLVYLDEQTDSRLLAAIQSVASPESMLAASLAFGPEGLNRRQAVAYANSRRRTGQMEPWLTVLSVSDYSVFFNSAGWRLDYITEAGGKSIGMLLITARTKYQPSA